MTARSTGRPRIDVEAAGLAVEPAIGEAEEVHGEICTDPTALPVIWSTGSPPHSTAQGEHVSEVTAIELLGPNREGFDRVLTADALSFVARLAREFEPARQELLGRRERVQRQLDEGRLPEFLSETASIRQADWKVAPIPADLGDRRVEITGPVDRKMIINALNSGARVFMADFEDANCPTWDNTVQGQLNLMDAVRREITWDAPDGTPYRLREETATLMVRPRGWHLTERHARLDGAPVSASLFDFGLFFFHNARALMDRGSGPYFYLPKLENHLEARLWNDVFLAAQAWLAVPPARSGQPC